MRSGIVEADKSLQVIVGKQRVGFGFLFEDNLQQDTAGYVCLAFLLNYNERRLGQHQVTDLLQGDVLAFLGIVEATIGVLLDDSGIDLFAHFAFPAWIGSGKCNLFFPGHSPHQVKLVVGTHARHVDDSIG